MLLQIFPKDLGQIFPLKHLYTKKYSMRKKSSDGLGYTAKISIAGILSTMQQFLLTSLKIPSPSPFLPVIYDYNFTSQASCDVFQFSYKGCSSFQTNTDCSRDRYHPIYMFNIQRLQLLMELPLLVVNLVFTFTQTDCGLMIRDKYASGFKTKIQSVSVKFQILSWV